MCFVEFIAYQCGHRSVSIMRPCALTTRRHTFPVCKLYPFKQHDAFTQCPVCERECHTRWVLIREAEHRWYHERGVCGCGVVFPSLDTTPQVIGRGTGGGWGTSGTIADPQTSDLTDAGPPHTAPKGPAIAKSQVFGLAPTGPRTTRKKRAMANSQAIGLSDAGPSRATGKAPATVVEPQVFGLVPTGPSRAKGKSPATIIDPEASDLTEAGPSRAAEKAPAIVILKDTSLAEAASSRAAGKAPAIAVLKGTSIAEAASSRAAGKAPATIIDPQPRGPTEAGPSRAAGKAPAVPPLFSEGLVGDQRHVAIRLSSLYAAEWLGDHREVHRSDPSHCETSLNPVRPFIEEEDMASAEQTLLRSCREIEPKDISHEEDVDDIKSVMVKVGDLFGSYTQFSLVPADGLVSNTEPVSIYLAKALTGARWPYVQRSHNYDVQSLQHTLHEDVAAASPTPDPLPVCGLPLGAGPEGVEDHMPSFYNCRLRRGVPKRRKSF